MNINNENFIEEYLKRNKAHPDEEFKQVTIKGKKLNYLISNYGRIYSLLRNKFLIITNTDKDGYIKTSLKSSNSGRLCFQLHRLVALHFCKVPRGNNFKVSFKDGNKMNVYYKNLNVIKINESNFNNKKYTDTQIENVCKLLSTTYMTFYEISKRTNVNIASVANIYHKIQRVDISSKYTFKERGNPNIDIKKIHPDEEFKNLIIDGEKTNYKISNYGRIINIKTNKMKNNSFKLIKKNSPRKHFYSYIYTKKNGRAKVYMTAKLVIYHFNKEFDISERNLSVGYVDSDSTNLYYKNLFLKHSNEIIK